MPCEKLGELFHILQERQIAPGGTIFHESEVPLWKHVLPRLSFEMHSNWR